MDGTGAEHLAPSRGSTWGIRPSFGMFPRGYNGAFEPIRSPVGPPTKALLRLTRRISSPQDLVPALRNRPGSNQASSLSLDALERSPPSDPTLSPRPRSSALGGRISPSLQVTSSSFTLTWAFSYPAFVLNAQIYMLPLPETHPPLTRNPARAFGHWGRQRRKWKGGGEDAVHGLLFLTGS